MRLSWICEVAVGGRVTKVGIKEGIKKIILFVCLYMTARYINKRGCGRKPSNVFNGNQ